MGSRNPDRIPITARRHLCETVGQMLAQRWQVEAWCATCRVQLKVDLRTIIAIRGPGFSLWNRNSRCRSVKCFGGIVHFYAKAPGMTAAERLVTPPPSGRPDDGWAQARLREVAAQKGKA